MGKTKYTRKDLEPLFSYMRMQTNEICKYMEALGAAKEQIKNYKEEIKNIKETEEGSE